jgi:hypothetical protein
MKKLIITTLAAGMTMGALAQGLINIDSANTQITTPGASATDPNSATTWYSPSDNLTINAAFYFLATGSATAGQINAINALDGTASGSTVAFNDMIALGFTEVSDTTETGSTIGSVNGLVNDGAIDFSLSTYQIGLSGAPTSSTGWLALVATGGAGAFSGDFGLLIGSNPTGGNPNASPAGTAANTSGIDAIGKNLVLEAPAVVPEPATLAFAGLGGLSMLLIRRRK